MKSQPGDGNHRCHWSGCQEVVPPAMWGCKKHWAMLPRQVRARIWNAFQPGQEKLKNPSAEYLAAADQAQKWILEHHSIKWCCKCAARLSKWERNFLSERQKFHKYRLLNEWETKKLGEIKDKLLGKREQDKSRVRRRMLGIR